MARRVTRPLKNVAVDGMADPAVAVRRPACRAAR